MSRRNSEDAFSHSDSPSPRGPAVPFSPTDLVREQRFPGPGAAKGLPVGALRAERSISLSALAPHAAPAKESFVDAFLRVSFPRACGKAAPPPWEKLRDIPVWQVDSLGSGTARGEGPFRSARDQPHAHNLNTAKLLARRSPGGSLQPTDPAATGWASRGGTRAAWPAPSVSASHRPARTKTEPRR